MPTSSVALTPHALLHIGPSQALHASQPNAEFSGLRMKSPYEGECEWRPTTKVTNLSNIPSVKLRSPEAKTGVLQLVLRLGDIWVSAVCLLGSKLECQAWCKPPYAMLSSRRCPHDLVMTRITGGDTQLSPEIRMGLELALKPNHSRAVTDHLPNGLSCHRLPISTCLATSNVCKNIRSAKSWRSIRQSLFMLKEINQMECEMCLHSHSHFKELIWRVLKPPNWAALQ